jgi:predicted XRE-type DNA-binding protein
MWRQKAVHAKKGKVKTVRDRNTVVQPSTGNVFADLELPNAGDELAKAKIVHRISKAIEEQGLTQIEAARILGIDQPKISALIRGRFGGFSLERLFRFLNALDQDVDIVIRPPRKAKKEASTRVVGD